jgi:hypothetical protein
MNKKGAKSVKEIKKSAKSIKEIKKGVKETPTREARLVRIRELPFDFIPLWLPYPVDNQSDGNRIKMRKLCRYLYSYHWLVGTVIDLFAEFPVTGLNVVYDNEKGEKFLKEFITSNKMQKLISGAGKEYWRLGEAFIGGEWNKEEGIWNALFIIPPEMVKIVREDILAEPTFNLKVSESLKKVIRLKNPKEKYEQLNEFYPELVQYIQQGKDEFPVQPDGNFKIWHWKHEANDYDDYGHPFLTRAFRIIMMEEKVLRALQAVNDWWQAPILHAKMKPDPLTNTPASDDEMKALEDKLVTMLAADNRVLVTDDLVDLSFVNLERPQAVLIAQLDKFTERILTALGINRAILQGEAVTYSGASIATDFLIQRFESYRQDVVDFLNSIAQRIIEVHGWEGQPSWVFSQMDFRDKNAIKEFVIRLKQMGIPISDQTLLDFAELSEKSELNKIKEENKLKAEQQFEKPQEEVVPEAKLPEESKEVSPRAHERAENV